VISRLSAELHSSASKISNLQLSLEKEQRKVDNFEAKDKQIRKLAKQLLNVSELDDAGVRTVRELSSRHSISSTQASQIDEREEGDRTVSLDSRQQSDRTRYEDESSDFVNRLVQRPNRLSLGSSRIDENSRLDIPRDLGHIDIPQSLRGIRRPREYADSENDENRPPVVRPRLAIPSVTGGSGHTS
jgi:hypothetical protein